MPFINCILPIITALSFIGLRLTLLPFCKQLPVNNNGVTGTRFPLYSLTRGLHRFPPVSPWSIKKCLAPVLNEYVGRSFKELLQQKPGLNDRTRTYDLYHPKVAFYQTELHPDKKEASVDVQHGLPTAPQQRVVISEEPASHASVVGRVGLEPTLSVGTWFTVKGNTNYTLPTHIKFGDRLFSQRCSHYI